MTMGRVSVLAAMLALAVASGCSPCPQAYLLQGDGAVGHRYNILILGAGFESDEDLQRFRKLASDYTMELMATPPLTEFADIINVYRMDVRTPPIGSNCTGNTCTGGPIPPFENFTVDLPGTAVYGGRPDSQMESQLVLTSCWTQDGSPSSSCSALWTGGAGQSVVKRLAFCGPDISMVVTIGNHTAIAGMGRHQTSIGNVALVVAGAPLRVDPMTSQPVFEIRPEGYAQLFHELGHGLGLLDEYDFVNGASEVTLQANMNVWQPMETWDPQVPNPPCPPTGWSAQLSACQDGLELCCANSTPGPKDCPLVRNKKECGYEPACTVVQNGSSAVKCACVENAALHHAGLWEGAFYQKLGYYRARNHCWMEIIDYKAGYCEGCAAALRRTLCEHRNPVSGCGPAIPPIPASCSQTESPADPFGGP
ncbi:MAG: M64 family metallo-endopeptidase [Acidobacteriota bacterium]|nr:M64 family metallo-endopeptidase [Acidobacteriota bacterium]